MNYKLNLFTFLILGNITSSANSNFLNDSNSSKISHKNFSKEFKRLELENKVLEAELKLKKLTQKNLTYKSEINYQVKLENLKKDAKLAEIKSEKLNHEMNIKKAVWELKRDKLEAEISTFKMKQELKHYSDKQPIYLDNPLLDNNNTLIISDRRISLNGVISSKMAKKISTKINYYNNINSKKPIFLVIDSSPGGSVMAGYLIIKSIESSKAPVYVVLKSFAASMAAIIVTFADKSFAYSHATMLHHQPSAYLYGSNNLTEQKENYKNLEKWWKYLATPIAKKMGITIEEFKQKMYTNSSKGDWSEFAVDAQKIHWVNHIVSRIEDTSVLSDMIIANKNQDSKERKNSETIVKNGKTIQYLPHLSPTDVYFLYSPDGYYQVQ